MSKVVSEDIGKFNQHYPKVAVIVTASARDRDDGMTAAWHSSISLNPPLYGVAVAPKRFTLQLVRESQEFGINFVALEKAALAASIGGTSGQEIDKFERFGVEKDKPLKTAVPILKDAYVAYECKLMDTNPYGDHIWMVGEILAVHSLKEAFTPAGMLDLDRIRPLLYLSSDFYGTVDKHSVSLVQRGI